MLKKCVGKRIKEYRTAKQLTQEELAEAIYVSRTAISKWESGRGYPSIGSLKEISKYFSVSIDELLSGDKLISIAEKENKDNIKNMCDLLFGIVDLFSVILIILPLYPDVVNGFIYSVNLLSYTQAAEFNIIVYWVMFISLFCTGVLKLVFTKTCIQKGNEAVTGISIVLNIVIVITLALTRQVYAVIVAFLLLVVKGAIALKREKA